MTDLNRGVMPPPLCHKNIPIEMNQYIYATIINDKPYAIIIDVNNVIHFMNDWVSNPDEFKLYEIHYQEKEYSIISEVLFSSAFFR